jgi:hypothetical protein
MIDDKKFFENRVGEIWDFDLMNILNLSGLEIIELRYTPYIKYYGLIKVLKWRNIKKGVWRKLGLFVRAACRRQICRGKLPSYPCFWRLVAVFPV